MNALGKTRQSSGYNMTLGRLLEGLDVAAPHGLQVTDLVQDSRAATPGCVFLACPASGGDPPLDIWIDGLRHVGVAISDAQGTPWPIGESGGRWLRVQRSPQTRVDLTAWHASPVGDATAGTAAASVEETIEPSNNDS